MRAIERTTQFRRDYKREKKGRHSRTLDEVLADVVGALAVDRPLARRHSDHGLGGEWSDCRDCHVKPDLVMIYQKPDERTLRLIRIGSHAELGL